jgi:Spy/CpxP family protein refolding chaperone
LNQLKSNLLKSNKMKKIMLSAMLLVSSVAVMAQPPKGQPGGKGDQVKPTKAEVEAQFVAYITSELELTPEEAKVFWPVHEQYRAELKKLHEERRDIMKERKKGEELTDAQVEEMIQKHFALKEKELALEKKYHTEFKKVLPIKKVGKLYRAEHQFKRRMLGEHGPHGKN